MPLGTIPASMPQQGLMSREHEMAQLGMRAISGWCCGVSCPAGKAFQQFPQTTHDTNKPRCNARSRPVNHLVFLLDVRASVEKRPRLLHPSSLCCKKQLPGGPHLAGLQRKRASRRETLHSAPVKQEVLLSMSSGKQASNPTKGLSDMHTLPVKPASFSVFCEHRYPGKSTVRASD